MPTIRPSDAASAESLRREERGFSRRALLIAAGALPLAARATNAAVRPWHFFVNVNLQGLEGGSTLPGRAGTDYFVASPSDFARLADRTTGPYRLPFRWERLQPVPGGPLDPTYIGEIRSVADAAAAARRTVVLDCHNYMHRLVDGRDRYVDGRDGVLTRDHLADLWTKLAARFATHPGIGGWDIMNEPQGLKDGQDLAAIMQAAVHAIDAVETAKTIYVEGDLYSSAAKWVANNPGYPLDDRHDRIVYSAHCYPDQDASGTHFDYAALAAHGIPDTILVDRSTAFAAWCRQHGLRGHIGETNVGTDDPRWLDVLANGLAFWKAQNIPVNLWLYAAHFGPNPYNLFPEGGREAPQWTVVARLIDGTASNRSGR